MTQGVPGNGEPTSEVPRSEAQPPAAAPPIAPPPAASPPAASPPAASPPAGPPPPGWPPPGVQQPEWPPPGPQHPGWQQTAPQPVVPQQPAWHQTAPQPVVPQQPAWQHTAPQPVAPQQPGWQQPPPQPPGWQQTAPQQVAWPPPGAPQPPPPATRRALRGNRAALLLLALAGVLVVAEIVTASMAVPSTRRLDRELATQRALAASDAAETTVPGALGKSTVTVAELQSKYKAVQDATAAVDTAITAWSTVPGTTFGSVIKAVDKCQFLMDQYDVAAAAVGPAGLGNLPQRIDPKGPSTDCGRGQLSNAKA